MVSFIEAIILSIIQGITEWFPVSSSGHLVLMQNIFGFQNLAYDVFLHFASLLAIVIIFWKEIIDLFKIKHRGDFDYLLFIVIALIPIGLVGYFFNDFIGSLFSNKIYLGLFFILSGIFIYLTKFVNQIIVKKNELGFFDSIIIGLFQTLAILPGVSRSGMTIGSGLFRGLSKRDAIRFSFLMAIPLILGASVLELPDLVMGEINFGILLISFIVTFLVSLIVIKLLLRIIESDKFWMFGIYDIVLGLVVLGWGLFG